MFLSNLLLLPSFLISSINFFNHPVRSSDEVKAGISKELQVFLDPALAETDRTIDGLLKLRKEAGLGKLEPYYGAISLVASLASDAEEKFLLSMKNAGHSDVDEKEYKREKPMKKYLAVLLCSFQLSNSMDSPAHSELDLT